VQSSQIAELLMSYIVGLELPSGIYDQLGAYLEILLRWNARTNLTAIRDPEQMVTRHFGESLFAAGVLFGSGAPPIPGVGMSGTQQISLGAPSQPEFGLGGIRDAQSPSTTLADLGSGAGFPGLPIKLAFPELHVTLIESQNKKATFLKEVIRALKLDGIEVYMGRAEQWGKQADVVTLRAIERFPSILPVARNLVVTGGRLCLLIGCAQKDALGSISGFTIEVEKRVPDRPDSAVVVGNYS
jgi:16S rRNA (guanine527-N7)-methyltransferase